MLRESLDKVSRLLRKSLISLLRGYQFVISPLLGNRCRFHPSCSHYAIDALKHYNLLKGTYLTIHRVLRCHPFHPGGYDPLVKDDTRIAN